MLRFPVKQQMAFGIIVVFVDLVGGVSESIDTIDRKTGGEVLPANRYKIVG